MTIRYPLHGVIEREVTPVLSQYGTLAARYTAFLRVLHPWPLMPVLQELPFIATHCVVRHHWRGELPCGR